MSEQLHCPHCGNPLVDFCEHCGTVIAPTHNVRREVWLRNVSNWSRRQLGVFWIVCVAVLLSALSTNPEYIGAAVPAYVVLLIGIPYALIVVTRKWLSTRH